MFGWFNRAGGEVEDHEAGAAPMDYAAADVQRRRLDAQYTRYKSELDGIYYRLEASQRRTDRERTAGNGHGVGRGSRSADWQ